MRIHLVALPNVQTTEAYDLDGFCTLTIRFAKLLKMLGHTVILYAGEENEAPCDELVTIVTKVELGRAYAGGGQYQHAIMEQTNPLWQMANPRISAEIGKRKQPRDIICTLGGGAQWPAFADHPELMVLEYSIGYVGNVSNYRIFQSAAWQHYCYGAQKIGEVRHFDAVIPAFFDVERFPVRPVEPYIVYLGRYVPMKGVKVACEAAQLAGVPLKLIGHGGDKDNSIITYGENLGPLATDARNEVLARATALICPTMYIEPFGCISPEAQLCGTPVICTDAGGFTETVEHGYTGFRCNVLGEYVDAIKKAPSLDRNYIRERARALYSIERAALQYKAYFDRLQTLWDKGWYTNPFEVQ